MSDFSDDFAQKIIDHVFNKLAYTSLSNVYVGLSTSDITASTTGATVAEPGANYSRVTSPTASWTRSGNTIDNDSRIDFVTANASWGTITWVFLIDSATLGAGNIIAAAPLVASKSVDNLDQVYFDAGALDFTIDVIT